MTKMVQCTVNTVEKDNIAMGGTECKFYRAYALANYCVFQYGSMRTGISGGSFKVNGSPGAGAIARGGNSVATAQIDKKINEGYTHLRSATFDVDLDKFTEVLGKQGDKGGGAWLENMFTAAEASNNVRWVAGGSGSGSNASLGAFKGGPGKSKGKAEPVVAPRPVPAVSGDRVDVLAQRALSAISLAGADPAKALTEYSALNSELDELDLAFRKARSYLSTLETLIEEVL